MIIFIYHEQLKQQKYNIVRTENKLVKLNHGTT